jgi:hypothetical protein
MKKYPLKILRELAKSIIQYRIYPLKINTKNRQNVSDDIKKIQSILEKIISYNMFSRDFIHIG